MSKPKPRASGADEQAEERDRSLGHYFAPEKVTEIANGAVPEFDIDPCAHPQQLLVAREKVVGSLLTEVDGYTMPWKGSCWLNPPNFKRLRKDVVANYAFHPFADWISRGVERYEDGDLDTLMVYSASRSGVRWFNDLMSGCSLQLTFHQRVNHYISQRDEDGMELEPREMTSPFGGSCLFLFTRDQGVYSRFYASCKDTEGVARGVLQTPVDLGLSSPSDF